MAGIDGKELAGQIIQNEMGQWKRIEKLGQTKNEAFHVVMQDGEELLIKIFSQENQAVIKNTEFIICELFKQTDFLKRVKAICKWSDKYKCSYIITEFLKGQTLLEKVERQDCSDKDMICYIYAIKEYLSYCQGIKTTGFGNIDAELNGNSPKWSSHLSNFLEYSKEVLSGTPESEERNLLLAINGIMAKTIGDETSYFDTVKPVLIPIDLNLSNFLINTESRLIVLDIDAFWSGDYLLAIGEFAAHIYGCKSFSCFLEVFGGLYEKESRRIHFYALLSSYSVMFYLFTNRIGLITETKPWGNPNRYVDLVQSHLYKIKNQSGPYEKLLLARNKMFHQEWGTKLHSLSERCVEPEVSLKRIEKLKEKAGITRVTDITGLDSTGVLAFQSIRPDAEIDTDTFTVFSGKGLTIEQCKVSAIMEAIERFSAEKANYPHKIFRASYRDMMKNHEVIHPEQFNIPSSIHFLEDEVLEWVCTRDILDNKEYYVTANCVFYPYSPEEGRMLFRYFTTGLSTGNNYLEAVSHGLAEVIERDAAAINKLTRNNKAVNLETISCREVRTIIQNIMNCNNELNLIVRYISAPDINVPVFSVIIEDLSLKDPLYISGGYGAHPNKNIALINALNEAALSRAGTISGAREDLDKFKMSKEQTTYEDFKQKYSYWFDVNSPISYSEIESHEFPTILEDIGYLVHCIREAGFERIIMADLTTPEIEVPVIKMLIPGVERYSYQMTCVGNRAKRFYNACHKI